MDATHNAHIHHRIRRRPYLSPSRTIITSFSPRNRPPTASTPNADADNDASMMTTTTTTPYEEGDWVLCLATDNHNSYRSTPESLACALSNGDVQVYDTQRLHLQRSFSSLQGTAANCVVVSDLQYGPQHTLVAAQRHGALQLMDLRQAQVASTVRLPSAALCLALGYEDRHVCAVGSTKGRIHFCDVRQLSSMSSNNNHQAMMNGNNANSSAAVLGTYHQSHQDDVTCLQFAPTTSASSSSASSLLLSGGEDGLMCLLDTTQPTEEAALQSVLNVGAPVRHAGFCGTSNVLYCLTGNETLSLWNADTASLLQNNTRQQLLAAATTPLHQQQPSNDVEYHHSHHHHHHHHNKNDEFRWNSMDYLVDAHWDDAQQRLVLLAGGHTTRASVGCSALFALEASPICQEHNGNDHYHHGDNEEQQQVLRSWRSPHQSSLSLSSNRSYCFQHLESLAVGGHAGLLRAWCPLGPQGLLTAGEDARLCEWPVSLSSSLSNHNNQDNAVQISSGAATEDAPMATATTTTNTMLGAKRPPTGGSPGSLGNGGGPVRRRQRHKLSSSPY